MAERGAQPRSIEAQVRPRSRSGASGPDVVAAGAVVVRRGPHGGEVLLVHRPKYDDWSWPKGKQEPGEHVTVTAVREVAEETGLRIRLGRPLPRQLYVVSGGRAKHVHYWVGRVRGDHDVAGHQVDGEIDEVGWFAFDKARRLLTYTDDLALLDLVEAEPGRTTPLVVVRHGRAQKRASWKGPDGRRPLTEAGRRQAEELAPVLAAYGVKRVVSSDALRCARTVAPFAQAHDLPVELLAGLNEDEASPDGLRDLADRLLGSGDATVVCTHRPVLPGLLDALGIEEEPLAPGEMVVCHHRKGSIVAAERHLVR